MGLAWRLLWPGLAVPGEGVLDPVASIGDEPVE
jgi:hypothetical protein